MFIDHRVTREVLNKVDKRLRDNQDQCGSRLDGERAERCDDRMCLSDK